MGTSSCLTCPHSHLVCSRHTPPIPTLPRYSQFPATPELPQLRHATRRAVRGARDGVTRGAVTRRLEPASRPASLHSQIPGARAASCPGLRARVGCNGLELGAPGSRRREHAPCALAGWRARARAGSGAGRTARAPARSVWFRWHSGPQPPLRSPARRPAEAGKGAVGAGRRPALGELGEERGGDGGRSRRGEGGGGAPFLFSDPGASGTQSPELGGRGNCGGPG